MFVSEPMNYFEPSKNVDVDERGRLSLGKECKGRYRVLKNSAGQILLDPITELSHSELRILADAAKKESIEKAIQQAKSGQIHDLGSFSQYAE